MIRFIIILVFSFLSLSQFGLSAKETVKVTASAPAVVTENQRFQLIFTIHNAQADSFRLPKIKSLKLLSGPSKNTSTSTQVVGGRIVSSTSVSLVYIAVAEKKGSVTVPAASIWSNGTKYSTNTLTITVQSQTEQQKRQIEAKKKAEEQKRLLEEAEADEITAEDLFIRTEWEGDKVYAGCHNNLLIKLYYRINVAGWDNAVWPDAKNCEITDAGIARHSRYGRAQVNGITYNTVVVRKMDVVPEKTGKLSFGSGELDVIVNVPNRNDFWGGYHRITKHMVIPGIVSSVKPASEKPQQVEDKPVEQPHWNL